MHIVKVLQTWLIKNGQGGLRSLSASSSLYLYCVHGPFSACFLDNHLKMLRIQDKVHKCEYMYGRTTIVRYCMHNVTDTSISNVTVMTNV